MPEALADEAGGNNALAAAAQEHLRSFLEVDLSSPVSRDQVRREAETLWYGEGRSQARAVDAPAGQRHRLAEEGIGSEAVIRHLTALAALLRPFDPQRRQRGGLLSRIAPSANRADRRLSAFVAVRGKIEDAVAALERDAAILRQSDIALGQYELEARSEVDALAASLALCEQVYEQLAAAAAKEVPAGDAALRRFLEDDLLAALERRRSDLATLLVLSQQDASSVASLRRTNAALADSVRQCVQATICALEQGITLQRERRGTLAAGERAGDDGLTQALGQAIGTLEEALAMRK